MNMKSDIIKWEAVMKQVWKCSYCNHLDKSPAMVTQHETECMFNPSNKTCQSCANQTENDAPMSDVWNGCSAGVGRWDQEDIQDGNMICDKWEQEK